MIYGSILVHGWGGGQSQTRILLSSATTDQSVGHIWCWDKNWGCWSWWLWATLWSTVSGCFRFLCI